MSTVLGNVDVTTLDAGFERGNGNAVIKPTMRILYVAFMVRPHTSTFHSMHALIMTMSLCARPQGIMNIVLFNAVIAIMGGVSLVN